MIIFDTGEPGAGKSYHTTLQIVQALVETEDFICTAEALDLPRLRQVVCQKRAELGIEEPFDMDERLLCYPRAETYEFWRYRSGGLVLDRSPDWVAQQDSDDEGKKRRMPKNEFNDWMEAQFLRIKEKPEYGRPVRHFVAEAHDYFDSQDWQTNGRATKFYATKHRHLRDNVNFTTHQADHVELRLRNLASEEHRMVNQARRSVGMFKMRPVFVCHKFYRLSGGLKKPYMVETITPDFPGIGSCYKTTGALGVHSKPEDEVGNTKGKLPWWMLPAGGVAIVLCIVGGFIAIPYVSARLAVVMSGTGGAVQKSLAKVSGLPVPKPGAQVESINSAAPVPLSRIASGGGAEDQLPKESQKPPYPTGYVKKRGLLIVTLSDGTTLQRSEELDRWTDSVLQNASDGRAVIGGRVLGLRPAPVSDGSRPANMTKPKASPESVGSVPASATVVQSLPAAGLTVRPAGP